MPDFHASLIIVRYPKGLGWAGFLSMALFRFPLWFSRFSFWKLMGCGKNGTFDKQPDWHQWAVLLIRNDKAEIVLPPFFNTWWKWFRCKKWILQLQPLEGHGTWDGKQCFGALPKQTDYDGKIAILTRATIRLSRLNHFWQHVDAVARQMEHAPGFITSVGIGEVPWIKQATFSIWENRESMKQFAYKMQEHAAVIRKTRTEKWYSEEMFVRFRILQEEGGFA
jgi:hypothetical protein